MAWTLADLVDSNDVVANDEDALMNFDKPATLIICGLIRRPDVMLSQLHWARVFLAEGLISHVVVSTWHGELDKYPEVLAHLLKMETQVIESSPPCIVSPGHVMHQAKANTIGLLACAEDANVLRIRPDTLPISEAYRYVLGGDAFKSRHSVVSPNMYRCPIWIPSGVVFWPFYLSDINYFGCRDDLLKLNNIDLKFEVYFNQLAPEQFFHLRQPMSFDPIFYAYATIQRTMLVNDVVGNRRYIDMIFRNNLLFESWLLYAKLLRSNYLVGFESCINQGNGSSTFERMGFAVNDQVKSLMTFTGGIKYNEHACSFVFHNLNWADAICNEPNLVRQLAIEINNWSEPTLWNRSMDYWNIIKPCAEMIEAVTSLKSLYVNEVPSIGCDTGGVTRMPLKAERFQISLISDPSVALREEVASLRKRIESMKSEI